MSAISHHLSLDSVASECRRSAQLGSVRRFLFSRPSFPFIFGDEQNSFQIQTARYDWPSEVEGLIPRPCLFSLREEQDTLSALCPCDYLSNLY